ncbi:MAG: tetratricopeptide repeat protein [Gemmatimonadaceae bacterium]|nr:tetratricopeptide repeat protein [Gemmatimonadaceae bacterium]
MTALAARHCFVSALLALAVGPAAALAQAPNNPAWVDSVAGLIARGTMAMDIQAFDQAIGMVDRVLAITPSGGVMLHYKGYALYRKASLMLARRARGSEIKPMLEEANDVLERSAAVLDWPETRALRAAILGQLIRTGGMLTVMRLGPRANDEFKEAMRLDPANPRVLMLRGVSAIYKPRMFGGGRDKAERDLRKALELFETDHPVSPAPSWGHAEAFGWLGQVLALDGKVDDARQAYQRALALEPQNGWVQDALLPALDSLKR